MKDQIALWGLCVIAVLLQIVVAPIIPVFSAVPSFIYPLVLVLAALREADTTYVVAFVMGFIADLLVVTPLGLTPLLLLLASLGLGQAFKVLDKTTAVMPIIAVAVTTLIIELVKLGVLLALGYQGVVGELLLQTVLPAVVVNAIIGAIYYFVVNRLGLAQTAATGNEAWATVTNTRF